jgi:hypothetical protein
MAFRSPSSCASSSFSVGLEAKRSKAREKAKNFSPALLLLLEEQSSGRNNINYKGESEGQRNEETYESSEATFTQNCFPSSNKINEAFSMGARGGSEISALEEPNEMVGR